MILPAVRDPLREPRPQLELTRSVQPEQADVLTPEALEFLALLADRFTARRDALLTERVERQAAIDAGEQPGFDPTTKDIREGDWTVAPIPEEVLDRRTEITGPVSRKMVINALNSGAQVYMADFEDSTAPSWDNVVDGQKNLADAVRGSIRFENEAGKVYELNEKTAVLMVRPRGLHLPEKHLRLAGRPIPGSLVDFGLFLFHNHQALAQAGSRPYFYIPKLEHYSEAAWWEDVIAWSERRLGLEHGTVKVTLLIETLPAVFQMDEILHALKDRILGLNCGRWDYIFSYIKTFRRDPQRVLPDRQQVGMTAPFLKAYSHLLIETCHRRGAFAMGGMAAQIPVRDNPELNEEALGRVRADKAREAGDGHDGTWVAHPGLEPLARAEFDRILEGPNQLHVRKPELEISEAVLIEPAVGSITEAGVRGNIRVALQYLAAWLSGNGCVPIDHLMEDAATAEISRSQLWQWRTHGAALEDGRLITDSFLRTCMDDEAVRLVNDAPLHLRTHLEQATTLLDDLVFDRELAPFITLPAYDALVRGEDA